MQKQFKKLDMNIKPIKSEKDYQEALKRLDELFDAKIGTPESDEADIWALLIDNYENEHYPIEAPDPIEAIWIRMEEMQIKQVDLIPEIGGKSRVYELYLGDAVGRRRQARIPRRAGTRLRCRGLGLSGGPGDLAGCLQGLSRLGCNPRRADR